VAGPPDPTADLTIGVTHAPYRRVLDAMVADALPLILAGHTHGGQVCVPGFGALTTNCDLPWRQAKGVSRWGEAYLHVSAGLGTSPYAPVRFACPPEATLLTLVARTPSSPQERDYGVRRSATD
jgi:predicted MPP superfamily phosphohydrolase